jgi:uncharacterized protein (DUF3820 family)
MYKKGFPAGNLGMCLNTLYEIRLNGLEHLIHEIRSRYPRPARK